jgi:16S rRNA (adenine1518-N6/adenine1519-N6)-dimethyltransferase
MGGRSRLVKSNDPVPKKRLGQHFLRDTGVIDRIVRWIGPAANDLFVEIGAGDGALSVRLAPRVAGFIAIELDSDCIPLLQKNLADFGSAVVVAGDVLELDLGSLVHSSLISGRTLRIAGNLPYNIATAIVEKVFQCGLPVKDMAFMVQQEVAQRITAQPGSRQYGYLSVFCQHRSEVQLGMAISPACFVPRPQVYSRMVSFNPRSGSFDPGFESSFETLAKAAFAYRRKTLGNSLRRHPVIGPLSRELLEKAGIDGKRRAEQLSVCEYEGLTRVLQDHFRAIGEARK